MLFLSKQYHNVLALLLLVALKHFYPSLLLRLAVAIAALYRYLERDSYFIRIQTEGLIYATFYLMILSLDNSAFYSGVTIGILWVVYSLFCIFANEVRTLSSADVKNVSYETVSVIVRYLIKKMRAEVAEGGRIVKVSDKIAYIPFIDENGNKSRVYIPYCVDHSFNNFKEYILEAHDDHIIDQHRNIPHLLRHEDYQGTVRIIHYDDFGEKEREETVGYSD